MTKVVANALNQHAVTNAIDSASYASDVKRRISKLINFIADEKNEDTAFARQLELKLKDASDSSRDHEISKDYAKISSVHSDFTALLASFISSLRSFKA